MTERPSPSDQTDTFEPMLLAANSADRYRAQLSAGRSALNASLVRLEGLARSVLPKAEADEALDLARCFRETAELAGAPVEEALVLCAGEASPTEVEALNRSVAALVRELEELGATAER